MTDRDYQPPPETSAPLLVEQSPEVVRAAAEMAAAAVEMGLLERERYALSLVHRSADIAMYHRHAALTAAAVVWEGYGGTAADVVGTAEEFLSWLQQDGAS